MVLLRWCAAVFHEHGVVELVCHRVTCGSPGEGGTSWCGGAGSCGCFLMGKGVVSCLGSVRWVAARLLPLGGAELPLAASSSSPHCSPVRGPCKILAARGSGPSRGADAWDWSVATRGAWLRGARVC